MNLKTLIIKDLKIALSDKKAFIILIGMPIILFSILSFALAGSFSDGDSEVWTIDIAVVKLYDLEADYDRIKDYASMEDFHAVEDILFDVLDDPALDFIQYELMTLETAQEAIEAGQLASAILLPEHYVSDMMMNMSPNFRRPVNIEVIKSVDMSYSSAIVENIVNELAVQMSQVMINNKVTQEVLSTYNVPSAVIEEVIETMQKMSEETPELKIEFEAYSIDQLKSINSGQYYSVAMMAMFLLFGASYGAKFMLEEKKKFTLQRQYVAGIHRGRMVFGKLFLIFMIAIMQIGIMIATSAIGFGVYWGNWLGVFLFTLLVAFTVTGFGTILSAVAMKMDSLKALNMLESGIFQVVALFGGSYFPLYLMPGWFQNVSKLLMNGAALDGYHKLMMDAPVKELYPAIISLVINGIVFMVIGMMIMNLKSAKTVVLEPEVAS